MDSLSNLIKNYILIMKVGFELLFNRVKVEPLPNTPSIPNSDFDDLSRFLRSSYVVATPKVFSSDNSLLSAMSYGDINDLITVSEKVFEALMLDKPFDFDSWLIKRSPTFIRTMFILKDGSFPDETETFRKLRDIALRLSEGYKLRKTHPDVGVNVIQNLYSAQVVLKDLKAFYMELFHEFRKFESGNHPNLHGGGR